MNDRELGKKLADEIAPTIAEEIADLDKRIDAMDLKLPKDLSDLLESKTNIKTRKKRTLYYKIAIGILIFFIPLTVFYAKSDIVLAVRNIIYELFIEESEESIAVRLEENIWKKYTPVIPEEFDLEVEINDKNVIKRIYSHDDYFISITVYTKDYELSIDNENLENATEITINNCKGKMITKKQITTILFPYDNYIFEVASNLSQKEILGIANSINDEKES